MNCYEIITGLLQVGNLMRIAILRCRNAAGGNIFTKTRDNLPAWSMAEDCLGAGPAHHSDAAGRMSMIMNGAPLAAQPTNHQYLIPLSGADEIAPVVIFIVTNKSLQIAKGGIGIFKP